ncbi:TMEM175 family protein [Sphingomonadaceae bacterium OTU29LAMAA1]|nr:TMEM175 family protein [Sphingomonadaceae bacterium OTU29LAMAA1]
MMTHKGSYDRMVLFSDAIFGVLITVLVLELRPPLSASLASLIDLWPTAVSYALSYLFVATVWINHHNLLRHTQTVTRLLIWENFAHLFSTSLLPFTTAWMAQSRMAAWPTMLYSAAFVLVNATYLLLQRRILRDIAVQVVTRRERAKIERLSQLTLCLFILATAVSAASPLMGIAIIIGCMAFYLLRDDAVTRIPEATLS